MAGRVGSGEIRLSVDSAAVDAGAQVVDRVIWVLKRVPETSAVRQLARMARDFPDIVLRVPEFTEMMGALLRHGEDGAVRRIIGEARRGRRIECQFFLVSLVDKVIETEGCSVAAAARQVFKSHGRELAKDARSIQNDYSRYKAHYDLWRSPKYVPDEHLTRRRWSP